MKLERSITNFIIVLVTTTDAAEAEKISKTLVEEKLAACCNIVDKVRSIYFWDGKLCDENESLILIKTKRSNFKKLEKRIKSLHSYQVPEIIVLSIGKGSEDYLKWVERIRRA
jgi:periplasmic divalent cation tolerance protein